ncbi:MAG TPA: SusC/RagA family TonB-linked outer membrane protein, partial [Butyricimonas virosa]|nr:SusC/RagA family TonB-linked outer membrane protein [Butyricimonas virosa]
VTVLLKGTQTGTSTDTHGKFRFPATKTGKSVLVFSFIGMKPVEKDVTPGKKIIVTMADEVEDLEEVIITGIYSRDKNSYTGSASTYSAKELKMVGAQNIIQSLKTLDPAMLVVESKQWGSDPNRMPKIEIRGKTSVVGLQTEFENDPNQPLFILDGVETTLETIINLNMDRVASVTILKDAAST